MGKVLRDKGTGRFLGSVGAGKVNVPAPRPSIRLSDGGYLQEVADFEKTYIALVAPLALSKNYADRIEVAQSEDIDLVVAKYLLYDRNVVVSSILVGNMSLPDEVFVEAINHPDKMVRSSLVYGGRLSEGQLAVMAKDEHADVRAAVAFNSKTPAAVLRGLVSDSSQEVLATLAGNVETPADVLVELAGKHLGDVDYGLASNKNTPPEILAELAGSLDKTTRIKVARNIGTPESALIQLSFDGKAEVRLQAVSSGRLPFEVLSTIAANDVNPDIRNVAEVEIRNHLKAAI